MRIRKRFRPELEALEDRWVPALLLDLDGRGNLRGILEASAGQSANVTVSVDPGNRVTVQEGATNYGTFPVARTLSISLGSSAPGFVNRLNLNNSLLRTNLRVTLGDQSDGAPPTQFRIVGGTSGPGTIDGNVNVSAGTGSQFVIFGELGQAVPHVTNITGSLTIDLGPGGLVGPPEAAGTVGIPPAPALLNVDGDVTVRNSTIFVYAGRIGGSLTVDSSKAADQLVIPGNFGRPFTVDRSVVIRTGGGNDSIDFQSALAKGNVVVDTGDGDDVVNFGLSDPLNGAGFTDVAATILGNLTVRLGGGNDTVNFGANSVLQPGSTVPFGLGGNLTVDGGDGNDAFTFFDAAVLGTDVTLRGDDGDDTVTVARLIAPEARLLAQLGRGDDTFRFADAATVLLERALLDGGPGLDDYVPGAGNAFDFTIELRDF